MFLAVVCMACAGISAPAQSLFDEIIYDGETVTADSAMVKAEAAAPVVEASRPQPRQRTLPRRQSRRGKAKHPVALGSDRQRGVSFGFVDVRPAAPLP